MRFESPAVENIFHTIPTDEQLKYSRLEDLFADSGKVMTVVAVAVDKAGGHLEVIIRLSEKFDFNAG